MGSKKEFGYQISGKKHMISNLWSISGIWTPWISGNNHNKYPLLSLKIPGFSRDKQQNHGDQNHPQTGRFDKKTGMFSWVNHYKPEWYIVVGKK